MSGDNPEQTQALSREQIEADLRYHGLEIVRLISDKGGMADVYEAWQPSVRRKVAAKRLKSHLVANPDVRARFEEEALLLGRLNHPNIVQVIDYSKEKLTLFLEFIEGQPLDEVLHARGRLPLEEALRITACVLDALAYAHAKNIVHRDVKPGNIFLTNEGLIKLGDFGIATIIGSAAHQGDAGASSWVGTPAYIAPEVLRGDAVDARADIYSAGVTLFLLLTGQLPFVGEDSSRTATLRLTHDPKRPSSLNPAIWPELDAVVLKAIARAPQARYQTAAEFKQALTVLRLARPQPGPYLSPVARARWRRRVGENIVLGVAAAVILAGLGYLGLPLVQGKGSVAVATNEPAEVYLDGKKIGAAPAVFKDIPAGVHHLSVEQPGFYRSATREVRVGKGNLVSVSESIPDGGLIVVVSAKPGSSVVFDGAEIGTTPLSRKVAVGSHVVEVAGVRKEALVLKNATKTLTFGKK